jgi:hypothetical protein
MNTACTRPRREAYMRSFESFTVRGGASVSKRACCVVGGRRFSWEKVKRARRCPMYSWRVRLANSVCCNVDCEEQMKERQKCVKDDGPT